MQAGRTGPGADVNPIAAILGRLPGGSAVHPADPLLPSDEVARQLQEVGADRGLLGGLVRPVSRALGRRIERVGLADDFDRPWSAALRHLPGREGDVFAGRSLDRQDQNPAERALRTAAWARAGAEVLQEAAEEHPALRSLRFDQGGAGRLEPVGSGPLAVAIVVMKGVWTLEAPAGRDVADLASEIGVALASGHFTRIEHAGPQRAPLAVLSDRRTLQHARHGHRANGLQGPWACLAPASRSAHGPPMELMGGWSLVAGHSLLATLAARIHLRADQILHTLPESTMQGLGRTLTRGFVDAWRGPESSVHRPPDAAREEFVTTRLAGDVSLERLAWATGTAVQRFLDRDGAVGVPMRVEREGDPQAVLSTVRFEDTRPEAFATFAARLAEQTRREAAGRGLLGDTLRRTVGQGSTPMARARLLARARRRGPLAGPYGWVTGAVRVARITADLDIPWELHAGGTPPAVAPLGPVPGGLSATLLVTPGRIELGLVGTGRFGERGAVERLASLIGELV